MEKICQANSGKVFRRIEKKYLISEEQKEKLISLCAEKIKKNKYFFSTVCSIYFDTENDDLIIKQIDKPLDKPLFKEKVRLRSYNVPKEDDYIFFEIKTKHKDISFDKNKYDKEGENGSKLKIGDKRRFELLPKDYRDWIDKKASLVEIAERKVEKTNDVQIAKEIEYLVKYLKLVPKVFIACERESYEGSEDEGLRITFDSNLRYRTKKLNLERGAGGKKYFKDSKNVILEIKTGGGMPLWLVHALNELKIYPQSFSKYGKIYQQMKGKKDVQYNI